MSNDKLLEEITRLKQENLFLTNEKAQLLVELDEDGIGITAKWKQQSIKFETQNIKIKVDLARSKEDLEICLESLKRISIIIPKSFTTDSYIANEALNKIRDEK